jgi:BioD-like phosphotransacetylase family protein
MKALYVTSMESFSGKTAICLGIGRRLQAEGHKVGYLKPLSTQPWQMSGHVVDEDATFVRSVLSLDVEPWDISPVVITPQLLAEWLTIGCDAEQRVREVLGRATEGKDVLLIEGGSSLHEGCTICMAAPQIAEMLDASVLVVAKFQSRLRLLDDILCAQHDLGERLLGVVINRVPEDEVVFIEALAQPFLEEHGIPVLGILPDRPSLAAISVGELVQTLNAEILTGKDRADALVETLTVGAMTAEAALSRLRRYQNKAVITGGDRTDIQLTALETSTVCLVLTGNLHPSPTVLERADEVGAAVLLVPDNTMETVEAIERVFGKTRLGHTEKLARFEALMADHMDYQKLFSLLGI